jgi:hypothetical protein
MGKCYRKHPPSLIQTKKGRGYMKISEEYPELLTADGFDRAIVGVVHRMDTMAICYDKNKVIEILMEDMSYEDAIEYFEFNIAGAWVGESTPFFLETMDL